MRTMRKIPVGIDPAMMMALIAPPERPSSEAVEVVSSSAVMALERPLSRGGVVGAGGELEGGAASLGANAERTVTPSASVGAVANATSISKARLASSVSTMLKMAVTRMLVASTVRETEAVGTSMRSMRLSMLQEHQDDRVEQSRDLTNL